MDFLFQVNEDGYPDGDGGDCIEGDYPFGFGSVYVYGKILKESIMSPCIGYWQFS